MPTITVNGQSIEAQSGMSLLQACLEKGIFIPNLCYLKAMTEPPASCRLCFVEIEGQPDPVAACTITVADGLVVSTDTSAVRQLQRTALQLLLSVHDIDCKNCPANKHCALQDLAKFLKVPLKNKPTETYLREPAIDETHPHLTYYPNRCILCGKCIYVCQTRHGQSSLSFAKRGFDTVISLYGALEIDQQACDDCQQCAQVCPVGALVMKSG